MREEENKLSIVKSLSTFKESEFITEGPLGEGAVGRVSLGTFEGGRDKVAVKYVSDIVSEEAFIREVNLLEKAKHPNIIPILGVMESKLQGFPYALVTQYMDSGSLYHLLKKQSADALGASLKYCYRDSPGFNAYPFIANTAW